MNARLTVAADVIVWDFVKATSGVGDPLASQLVDWLVRPAEELQVPCPCLDCDGRHLPMLSCCNCNNGWLPASAGDSGTADIWRDCSVLNADGWADSEPIAVCDVQVIDRNHIARQTKDPFYGMVTLQQPGVQWTKHVRTGQTFLEMADDIFDALPDADLLVFCTNLREAEGT